MIEIKKKLFDEKVEDIYLYELKNAYLSVVLLNLGASIVAVKYEGIEDVLLGYDTLDAYEVNPNYFGSTIGRCANRIKNAHFTIDETVYELYKNDGSNSLHGGREGFDKKIFDVRNIENGICMRYLSKDGEENYPGNVTLEVSFTLNKDTLRIDYKAVSDKKTLLNLTNHMYIALQGAGCGDVYEQVLRCDCEKFMENDAAHLATGNFLKVEGSAHDFRISKPIKSALDDECDAQIALCGGLDHYYQFTKNAKKEVVLVDEKTHRKLIVTSDMPGFHLYVPNYETAIIGKQGKQYKGHCAVCIETSYVPDAIHIQEHPDTLFDANEVYTSFTTYQFTKQR
ncbi:MAG: aldose epimerase family protein [Breznakia sp.]